MVKKYGATKNCPGCSTIGRTHTETCRKRLTEAFDKEQEDIKDLEKQVKDLKAQFQQALDESTVDDAVEMVGDEDE